MRDTLSADSQTRRPPWWIVVVIATVAVALVALLVALPQPSVDRVLIPERGLPRTEDYHSLLVAPDDPSTLVLGTHDGLFRSTDAGVTWSRAQLDGRDAMNLVRTGDGVVWAAGHLVLARSQDDGRTWTDMQPRGIPSLDVHGFAVHPRDSNLVYAAIAGEGLFRSRDGGRSFERRSRQIGAGVSSIAVLGDGRLLAADPQRELVAFGSDGGAAWEVVARLPVAGVALHPENGATILASGPGVLRSTDGGRTWVSVHESSVATGPIAIAPSNPRVAYVVGLDRSLWTSADGGSTWRRSVAGESG
jgi:photosystem II stability/assembly factor-like uncharacterized protein